VALDGKSVRSGPHAARLATVWPQPSQDVWVRRRAPADDRWRLSRENATGAYVGGRPRTLADVLIIRRSQVQVLPAPPIYLRFRSQKWSRWVR
jgi:hypothetical protein